jgi:hypothetical protein
MTLSPQKITFGEMRASGVRDVLIYCCDHRCSHSTTISAEQWPDHVRLSDIEPDFLSAPPAATWRGSAPKFSQASMGTG